MAATQIKQVRCKVNNTVVVVVLITCLVVIIDNGFLITCF